MVSRHLGRRSPERTSGTLPQSQYLDDDKIYNSFIELKDFAGFYRTCVALQNTSISLRR